MSERSSQASIEPGRSGEVRGISVSNARFSATAVHAPDLPCVRLGSSFYPHYAKLAAGGGYRGGWLLTPDEADTLAAYLQSAAAWARAQALVDHHEDMA